METDVLMREASELLAQKGLVLQEVSSERHYWFIRTQGGSYFEEFFLDGFVAIGHEDVDCVAEDDRTEAIIEKVKETHPQATRVLNQVYKFCNEIHCGDIVIIPSASSAQFAFGYIEDNEVYTVEVSDEDIDDGKCPYKRRRKTHWVQGIPKARVDSKLYTFFRNQQAISNVDDYSEYIERALHPLYMKNGLAHLTLTLLPSESPYALDIPIYMQGILKGALELTNELGLSKDITKAQSRTNVQSAGLIELFGNPAFILLIAVIVIGLFGGTVVYRKNGENFECEMGTGGLIDAILKIWDKVFEHEQYLNEVQEAQSRLEIQDPRDREKLPIGFRPNRNDEDL